MARGVRIERVEPGTPAARAGLEAGDRLLSINAREVEDHLDVRFHAALGDLDLAFSRGGKELRASIPEEPYPLRGVTWEEIRPRRCGSACIFCFVDQLPESVRPSLLVKDEDFRLSFLHGNYITLSTLREKDIERIIEQRLSPLYVSVHAVDDAVRAVLMGRTPRRPLLPTMDRLLSAGIELWGQVVLCPGVNDGAVLDETVRVLAERHPGMRGFAVVPLGLSDHGRRHPLLRPVTREAAAEVLARVETHQSALLPAVGTRFVFAADEFYLKAGAPIPPGDAYEEYGMLEDGVGMVRSFRDAFEGEMTARRRRASPLGGDLTVVTGTLFAPVLEPLLARLADGTGTCIRTLAVRNRFLGGGVNVAGLLAGADVARALRASGAAGPVAIPAEMVSRANGLLLDDYTPERVREEGGSSALHVLGGAEELVRLVRSGAAPAPRRGGRGS